MHRLLAHVLLLLAAATFLSAGGCGYHPLTSTVVREPATVKSIHIPVFVNRSYRATLEAYLANSITEQFARRRGEWQIAGEGADYLLSGTIISYDRNATAFSYRSVRELETIAEYRAVITTEITLKKRGTREALWKRRITRDQYFPANTDISIQQNSEEAAIREVCEKLAQEIYVSLSDDF